MEFFNETRFPSLFYRTALENDLLAASVALRVTYDVQPFETQVAAAQTWPMSAGKWETSFGPMESDHVFQREGVDLFVFGDAYTPSEKSMRSMMIRVSVQKRPIFSLKIFGDRHWEKSLAGFTASEPTPFTRMSLSICNAFGGVADWDGLKLPYGNNPFGKGFIWGKEKVEGAPLPNLEHPTIPITDWQQRPDPICTGCCPLNELRTRRGVVFDEEYQVKSIRARLYNTAFPGLVLESLQAGDQISVEGVLIDGNFIVIVPKHNLWVNLQFGTKTVERPLVIDQIGLLPNTKQIFVTYRHAFKYEFRALEKRSVHIFEKP